MLFIGFNVFLLVICHAFASFSLFVSFLFASGYLSLYAHCVLLQADAESNAPSEKETPTEASKKDKKDIPGALPEYRPLPQEMANLGEHTGTFGVSKYVYYGKHSEGNRFIRNNDL